MKVINELHPEDLDAFQAKVAGTPPGRVVMVNLLKFRDQAEYEEEGEGSISGEEAYSRYLDAVYEVLPNIGAKVIYEGRLATPFLGQVEDLWDKVLLIEYPDIAALMSLGEQPGIQEALKHRAAGLSGQLLITAPQE